MYYGTLKLGPEYYPLKIFLLRTLEHLTVPT